MCDNIFELSRNNVPEHFQKNIKAEEEKKIAIYHFTVSIVSCSSGASCVAKAAYLAGEKIKNERDGVTHDYRRKHEVVHKEIMLPAGAPERFRERAVLWNAAEQKETRKNSQTARSVEASLPRELSREDQLDLIRKFCNENFVAKGMCVDFAIHDKDDGNPHVHILLPTRRVDDTGFTVKDRSWNNKAMLEQWRASWADWCNHKLQFVSDERIDHRSYKDQGIEKIPTIHLGAGACAIEKKGLKTDRGIRNRKIEIENIKSSIKNIKSDMGENMRYIMDESEKMSQAHLGCSLSETCSVIYQTDYISFVIEEIKKRNEHGFISKVDDERSKMTFAKRNIELVNEITTETETAKNYVFEHGLHPPNWNEIFKAYNDLRQQEEQQTQNEEKPVQPTPDTPSKPTNRSKPLRH